MKNDKKLIRCEWCLRSPEEMHYHDHEWGVPKHDDQVLFEYLILDAFQAGLSWTTIIRKRENFRKAFDQFNAEKIARYGSKQFERLMNDAGIIRNRQKIEASIRNAKGYLKIQEEFGSFDKFIWQFTGNKTFVGKRKSMKDIPATSAESDAMSKELKRRGFGFVGSTICYAFMQAAGMVNDHKVSCFRYKEV